MRFLKSLGFPIILLVIYLSFLVFLRQALPPEEELIAHLTGIYDRYGYEMIFVGAFLESLILVNFLVPGVVTIGLGAVFAKVGDLSLSYVILAATAGCMLGYIIDYVVGYLGLAEIIKRVSNEKTLEDTKKTVEKYVYKSFALGYIHPNLGAFLSIAVGASKITFRTFLIFATLATLFWMSLWGILIFTFGKLFLVILTKYVFALTVLIGSAWFIYVVYSKLVRK
jgi:membrane-associated protein